MRLTTFHVKIFLTSAVFFIDFQKNMSCGIIQPQSTLFDVFGILIGHLFFSKNLNNRHENMFTSAENEW